MNGTVVVIPAYNEAARILGVIQDVVRYGRPARVIVVDDGSVDGTAALVQDWTRSEECVASVDLIRHPTNLGKGFALSSGVARALAVGAERITTIDADGQHDGADLPRLDQLAARYPTAIVIGARTADRDQAPALRRFANEVADFWISWACGRRIHDTQSGLRLYPADLLARIDIRPRQGHGFAFETELLIKGVGAGADVRSIPIATRYHPHGRASHYRPWRDTWSIIQLVGGHLIRRGLHPRGLLRALSHNRAAAHGQSLSLHDGD
jgi:glycosyltransferase involved in cell wall biosynthesis